MIRRFQVRELVSTVADALSRAQGGSEQAFAQVLTRPQLWAPAATWLERGVGQLVTVRSTDHTREDSHADSV